MRLTNKLKIVLADAQPFFREGLKYFLNSINEGYVVEEADNTDELIYALKVHQPEILVLGYSPLFFDIKQISRVLNQQAECDVILFSSNDKRKMLDELSFKYYSLIEKEAGKKEILRIIKEIYKTKYYENESNYNSNNLEQELIESQLTEREKQIIVEVARGKKNKEIGESLSLSPHTVHSHRKNIMKKLNLHSAFELANYVREKGLV